MFFLLTYLPILQELCVAVSVLLHYFYLAAFCLMLVEAVQLLLSTVFVFHAQTRAQTAGLVIAAWSTYAVASVVDLRNNYNELRLQQEFV